MALHWDSFGPFRMAARSRLRVIGLGAGWLRRRCASWRLRRSWRASGVPAQKLLVVFLPERNQGWILQYIWNDLVATVDPGASVATATAGSLTELHDQCKGKDCYALVMDLKCLGIVLRSGFPPERVVFYHTHVRLGLRSVGLDRVHAVLALNRFEAELLLMNKVERCRVHLFPAGFDPDLFFAPSDCCRDGKLVCAYDILFVGRYRPGRDGYYHKRKRYGFQVALANQLVDQGWRVGFLGPGWDSCEYILDRRIQRMPLKHADYGSVYRNARMVCCVSSQEGGPVSYLEGMACGCLMLSTPTGFAADVASGSLGSWLLPLSASPEDWSRMIGSLLNDQPHCPAELAAARAHWLEPAQFAVLARQILQICWPTPVARGSLS